MKKQKKILKKASKKKVVKKKEVEKTPEEVEMKVLVQSNQHLEVVIPGVRGIFVLRPGENEIKARDNFTALELAEGIVRDHKHDRPELGLNVVVK